MLNLRKLLGFKPKLELEALKAYYHRLPEILEVNWFRDGKFIVGKIKADEYEFMTQGRNADDFIEMVNDAIYAVENIPEDYIETLQKIKAYKPPKVEEAKLRDLDIQNSAISFKKREEVLKLA